MKDFIIDPSNVDQDPTNQFRIWFEEYLKTNPDEATAVFLATANSEATPSGRVVLLKAYDKKGFVFFTNYESRKGCDIQTNPLASMTFYWSKLNRQVRVFGSVEKLSVADSDTYFASRPFESRIGAVASHQGKVLQSREVLTERIEQLEKKYAAGGVVPRPENWGGYRVCPTRIEFWQGRENRVHDRVEYFLEGNVWKRQRLSP